MRHNFDNAIANSKAERDRLCEECFQLLHQISHRPGCLKLLNLARGHLRILAAYKGSRGGFNQSELTSN